MLRHVFLLPLAFFLIASGLVWFLLLLVPPCWVVYTAWQWWTRPRIIVYGTVGKGTYRRDW